MLAADAYRGLEPNKLMAILIAAAGAWLFFRGATPWARLGILVGASFLGKTLIALGIYWTYPSQSWVALAYFGRNSETLGAFANAIGIILLLLVPAGLSLFPPPKLKVALSE